MKRKRKKIFVYFRRKEKSIQIQYNDSNDSVCEPKWIFRAISPVSQNQCKWMKAENAGVGWRERPIYIAIEKERREFTVWRMQRRRKICYIRKFGAKLENYLLYVLDLVAKVWTTFCIKSIQNLQFQSDHPLQGKKQVKCKASFVQCRVWLIIRFSFKLIK